MIKMVKEIAIEIENLSEDCIANKEMKCGYGVSIMGNDFGFCGPCKDKDDIIKTGKDYIKSESQWFSDQLKIVDFKNSTELNITKADFEGNNKLDQWVGA